MKKDNTAEKTLLKVEQLTEALKEQSKMTLESILSDTIDKMLMEGREDDEEGEDNSYEEEDVETEETPVETDESGEDETPEEDPEAEEEETEDEGDDEWSDMEEYKVGDDEYDLSDVDGETALKVYNKLGDDDQIFVKKTDDGSFEVKDEETGAEYVIELDPDALDDDATEYELEMDAEPEAEIEIDFDEPEEDGEIEVDFDEPEEDGEIEVDLGDDEEDEVLDIDLGDEEEDDDDVLNETELHAFTDSYQKDVFKHKFNMKEPANPNATIDADAGAPKGAEKPWAGKGDMKPFGTKKDTLDECGATDVVPQGGEEADMEEGAMTTSTQSRRKMTHTPTSEPRANATSDVDKLVHACGEYVNELKQIQAENKQYKKFIAKTKQALMEAAALNVNMGKVLKLIAENTTTSEEKKMIFKRFSNVKTIQEGKTLYESIKRELNSGNKTTVMMEQTISAKPSSQINETTMYMANNPVIELMNRMDNLYK